MRPHGSLSESIPIVEEEDVLQGTGAESPAEEFEKSRKSGSKRS